MALRYSPILYSREGSLVPGMDVVKPLFCFIHTPSRQGLLYSCFYAAILPLNRLVSILEVVLINRLLD